jgi:hypothetical protein
MYETGDVNAGTISISQSIGLVKKVMPAREIVQEMMAQAEEIHGRMGKLGFGRVRS